MINKIFSQQKDDFHNIYNIFGLKFKFKDKKNIIKKCGRNNHVYILFENGFRKEIFYSPFGLNISIHGNNNKIVLKKPFGRFKDSKIQISKTDDSYTEIGFNTALIETVLSIHNGENQKCIIGNCCSTSKNCCLYVHNNSQIIIGDDCMLSQNVTLWGSDGHSIIDTQTNQCINKLKEENNSIVIGKHCWLGFDATILKNSRLGNNCILGAKSLLNKNYSDISNTIFAGNPCSPVKNNINWNRKSPNLYSE